MKKIYDSWRNDVLNEFAPSYGIEDEEVDIEQYMTPSSDLVQNAIQDAIDKDMLDEEMGFAIEDITNDPMLNMVAGKISSVASSKDFRRYLKEVPDEMGEEMKREDEEMTEEEDDEPNTRNVDALFLERL